MYTSNLQAMIDNIREQHPDIADIFQEILNRPLTDKQIAQAKAATLGAIDAE